MYEQSARWNEYYRETDRKRRLKMRNQLFMLEPDDGANEYRKKLYECRYINPRDPEAEQDLYLWHCVNFSELGGSARLFKGRARKEILEALKQMGFSEMPEYGPEGEKALYWEIRNGVKRYFETCKDTGYRRQLFGLLSTTEEDRLRQMCKDAWNMSVGIAVHYGLEEELKLWKQAVQDQYFATDVEAAERFRKYDEEQKV